MQFQFDPNDPRQLAAVAAAVNMLQFGSARETAAIEPRAIESADEVDPAAAFGESGNDTVAAAPASPTETAPAAPAAPPTGVELDAAGLPWDARIHSGPADKKPKNADGTWRSKRGAGDNPEFVKEVEAELRAVMGAPAPSPTAPAAPPSPPVAASPVPAPAEAPTAAPAAPPPTSDDAATAFGAAAAEPAPSAPPPAPAAVEQPAGTFAELMKKITARQTAGTLTVADTKATAEALGLTGVADLLKRPDLIAAFEAALPSAAA